MRGWLNAATVVVACVCVSSLASCADQPATVISDHPPTPWPVVAFPELPPEVQEVPDARVALGEILFFDPILSRDGETACGTCHSEFWGMSDALDTAVGHGAGLLAGPGRKGPNVLRRNSQGLWNVAFRGDLFWDGRTATLEDQAIEPLLADDELARDPAEVVSDIASIDEYRQLFRAAFPEDPHVTMANMASALAAFQRTLISNSSLYDGYLSGDEAALSPQMFDGMFRFAEFECNSCHTPPLFESDGFFDRSVPNADGIDDKGRFEVTGDSADMNGFRVPTLRNIAFTEPYFHNGVMRLLEDAVRHELTLSGLPFDEDDVELISTFIDEALRDERNEPERPRTVPSGLRVPLDGTVIDRSRF